VDYLHQSIEKESIARVEAQAKAKFDHEIAQELQTGAKM